MDLIRFATYIVQELEDEKQTYIKNLISNPEQRTAGYIDGLQYMETTIRKIIRDLEGGNFREPERITISPLSDQYTLTSNGKLLRV